MFVMRGILFIALQFVVSATLLSSNAPVVSLKHLDQAIARKNNLMQAKEARIDSLKAIKLTSPTPADRFFANRMIYKEYRTYQYDSAYNYVSQNLLISEQLDLLEYEYQSKLDLVFILISSGLYKESVKILESIDPHYLSADHRIAYYECYTRVYQDLTRFMGYNLFTDLYWNLAISYLDSLLIYTEGHHPAHLFYKGQRLMFDQRLGEAKEYFLHFLDSQFGYSQYYSMTAATLSFIYRMLNNGELMRQYLILSAISDIECSITENESLYRLALLLFEDGNTKQAYKYIKIALDDANFYNARLRRVEIANSQPIIEKEFLSQLNNQRQLLTLLLFLISILTAALIVVVFRIVTQLRELRRSRMFIQYTNKQLITLNNDLIESNRIKEEYIGHFLNLCSQYIDKIEKFKKLAYRKIKLGQVDSLFALVGSRQVVENELHELLLNFDRIFLKLFPNFVDEFNALFKPENQITLKKDELLSTELRIFALIRLGVNDSSKIAQFLRYAPNTIYTYRTKIKNKSIVNRTSFEEEIMKIGGPRV